MNKDLKNKRLMMMGGVQATCEVIKEAQKLGVIVLETDYLVDSPAKKIADKSFMVSTTDPDAVAELCRIEKVDGVFTCYTDLLLPYCQQVCERLGKPFWGNANNIGMCIDKKLFKLACEQSGVPVVPWKLIRPDTVSDMNGISFPVVIKPTDNSGSRGVYKCYREKEYLNCCEKAFQFSKKKELMVERLMDVNSEFSAYYFLHHGKAYLTSMGDRYVDVVDPLLAPQAKGMFLPSIHLEEWINEMDERVKSFFSANGMTEGYVFLQGFHDNGCFYLSEIGYRLNGGDTYKIVELCSGVNIVQQLLSFSLTGNVDEGEIIKFDPNFKEKAFLVTIALKNGVIGGLEGIDVIMQHPDIRALTQMHFVGDELSTPGTNAQIFAYFMCVAESEEKLREAILFIKQNLKVIDMNGNNLLVGVIDPQIIKFT